MYITLLSFVFAGAAIGASDEDNVLQLLGKTEVDTEICRIQRTNSQVMDKIDHLQVLRAFYDCGHTGRSRWMIPGVAIMHCPNGADNSFGRLPLPREYYSHVLVSFLASRVEFCGACFEQLVSYTRSQLVTSVAVCDR
jgi:hypothetical protein